MPKIGRLRTVKKSGLRLGRANLAKFVRKTAIWFKVRAAFARADKFYFLSFAAAWLAGWRQSIGASG